MRIETLVRAAVERPLVPLVLALVGAVAGTVSMAGLPRDVFPDLSTPVFQVIVQNPTMSVEELERAIAIPLESALGGLPGVRRVRSTSQLGVTQVTVQFEPDADWYRARQSVIERVTQVAPSLPEEAEPPLITGVSARLNEVMEIVLEADPGSADLMLLRDLAELEVHNRLIAVPGVAAVERLGGYLRQFRIEIDPERMAARGITVDEVLHAASGASAYAAGGVLVEGPMEWTVRALGKADSVEALRDTVVAVRGTTPILLGDVADIREAPAFRRGIAHGLGGEVVSCRIVKQPGADTVEVSRGVRAAVAELSPTLPPGVRIRVVYDQATLIERAVGGVGRAIVVGAVLVVLVLLALLGDWRGAAIVALTIPLSIALAAVLLARAGIGLNTMTLGGLAIAVGLLVDASIIVVENIAHRLAGTAAQHRRERAAQAVAEVARPIVFATAVVLAVFMPMLALEGIEGRLYGPLAAAVVAAMLASLFLALTFTPVVATAWLGRRRSAADGEVALVRAIKRIYGPLLDACMRHAGAVRAATLLVTVPAMALALTIGTDFVPPIDEGAFIIETFLPPEASLDTVDRVNQRVEDLVRRFPEVEDVVRRTGRSERTADPMPHNASDVLVVLRPGVASSEELAARMREALASIPGVQVRFTTPLAMRIDEGLGGTPADLAVRIFGPDLEALARLADQAARRIAAVPGIEDVRIEPMTDLPQIRVEIDRRAVARVGLTPGDVVRAVRIGLVGAEVGQIWRGQRRFDLVVRLGPHVTENLAALRGLLLDAPGGTRIPLSQLARIERTTGPSAVRREAGSRRIAVEASVEGRDLGSAAADVRRALEGLDLPTRYFFEVGGRVESQVRALRSLGIAILIAVVAVVLLLHTALGSLAEALVVLATLPDALVGGVVALWLTGETWNVSSLVGVVGLFGIAVQNGLVLVTQTRSLVAEGLPFEEALRTASLSRVRPKLMTAGTAVLGLLPILVLPLSGVEVERPLAIVMSGGLVTSTAFTLLALPTFYALVARWRRPRANDPCAADDPVGRSSAASAPGGPS